MKFVVYEDNFVDSPVEVEAEEIAERALEEHPDKPTDIAVNATLVSIGSFDPRSEEYRKFVREVESYMRTHTTK